MAMFDDIRGEEQPVVRWNPTAWGCKAWPVREKKVAPAQEEKQRGIRHLGWQDLRTKEMAAKAWEEKWLESVKAVDRGGRE